MDRKDFLRASLGLAAGATTARAEEPQTPQSPLTPCEERSGFANVWIKRFMDNLDAHVDEPKRIALLETRGRACARRDSIKAAQKCEGDIDKLMATMGGWLGAENAKREGNVVHVTYPKCLCPMAAEVTEKISGSYCHCSVGWLKEMYETVVGKPVKVEALETIKRGGTACRFTIHLEA